MYPFSLFELGERTNLGSALQWGTLPLVIRDLTQARETLASHLETYLREEIKAEAIVRRLEEFSRFLEIAGQLNGQVLSFKNISRETGKSGPTTREWYGILEDTLMGYLIPPYRPGLKVREAGHPKFYWCDAGVARAAGGLIREEVDHSWLGFALENLVLNELLVYNESSRKLRPISYYAVPGAGEIDFVVTVRKKTIQHPDRFITIEVKLSDRWKESFESPARALKAVAKDRHVRMIGVYTGKEPLLRHGYEIYPVMEFISKLHNNEIF